MFNEVGKQVWPRSYGYCTRHWFATQFLIANEFNFKVTAVVEKHYLKKPRVRAEVESRYHMPQFRSDRGEKQ